MAYWMKLGHFTDLPTKGSAMYWLDRTWINDGPGIESSRWERQSRPRPGDEYPPYSPQYERGDKIVIYTRGEGCQAIHEVDQVPVWAPDEIAARGAETDPGRWAVLTETVPLCAIDRDESVPLAEIDVPSSAVGQKGWISLSHHQYELAGAALDGTGSRLAPPVKAQRVGIERVPVEEVNVDGYEVRSERAVTAARRREAVLVRAYREHLERQGNKIDRVTAAPDGRRIYGDLYNESRHQIVEAKAAALRSDVRMAIGQLADYSRFATGARKAVLTEDRPSDDLLELLERERIASIWREGEGFADTAGGAFT